MNKRLFIIMLVLVAICTRVSAHSTNAPRFFTTDNSAGKMTVAKNDSTIYEVVDEMPKFPGGEIELGTFLIRNMKYPKDAEAKKQQGRIIVRFVIKTNGSVGDICVAQGVCESIDAEAVLVIKAMPKWTPGKKNGKPVNVRYSIPMEFRLK